MKSKLTKEQIEQLNGVKDEDKAELLTLFSDASEAETRMQELRKSQPRSSQLVVEKSDFSALQKSVEDRDTKIKQLEEKLQSLSLIDGESDGEVDEWLSAFSPIIGAVSSLLEGKNE